MTATGDPSTQFTELEHPELTEYRAVNTCAVIAIIVGILSSLALTHLMLCVIPLAGIVLAVRALQQLSWPDNKQSGRRLAMIALALSAFFGSWAVARELSREARLYGQARIVAETWFGLVRDGKLQEAHQLATAEELRAAPGESLSDYYAEPASDSKPNSNPAGMMEMMMRPHVDIKNFYQQAMVRRIRNLGSSLQVEFRENRQLTTLDSQMVEVQLLFELSGGPGSESRPFSVLLSLIRQTKPGLAADWRIQRVADPYAP